MKERSFWLMLVLSIITCGIYGLYFWYVWTEDVNKLCEGDGKESMNYILVWLLSIITCGIYMYVWYYKMAERVADAGPKYGVEIRETGSTILLWMILGSFICGLGPIIAQYMMIANTNKLVASYNYNNGITA